MKCIRDGIAADPKLLETLAKYHDQVHSPSLALKSLGLSHHPSVAKIKNFRDPMHSKIIYHCDPATMFQPALKIDPPRQPPPAKALPPPADEAPPADDDSAQAPSAQPPERLPLRRIVGKQARAALMPPAATDESALRAAAAETLQLERPTACEPDDMLRHYILQAMSVMLEENTGAVDSVYSVPFAEEALRSLSFVSLVNTVCDKQRQRSVDLGRMAMRGHVFLQLVRKALGKVTLPEATGLNQHDWAVNFLEVQGLRKVADESYEVDVGSSPICLTSLDHTLTPVVLSLDALPLDSLLGLRLWKQRPRLHYKFVAPNSPNTDTDVTDDVKLYESAACESLLEDLLAGGPFSLQGQDSLYQDKSKLLELLLNQGLVRRDEHGGWSLTSQGHACVSVSTVLLSQERLVRVRDVPFSDMEVMELLLTLRKQKWSHRLVASRKGLPSESSYVEGTSEKTWYSRSGELAVCREYLLCLLTAGEHKQAVPHLQKTAVYSAILGKPVKTVQRRKQHFMFLDDEHLLGVDDSVALSLTAPKKRARRSKTAVPSFALEDDAEDGGGGMAEAMLDAAEAAASDENDDDDAVRLGDLAAAAPSGSSSSSSSSSSEASSSSSSSGSSSSSTSSSSGSGAARKRAVGHKRRTDTSTAWGICRITPTHTGFQITCKHPKHGTATTACTKTRSSNIEGSEMALRLLKTWALWGRSSSSKDEHQKKVWKKVMQAQKNGTLPTLEELDAAPLRKYPAR